MSLTSVSEIVQAGAIGASEIAGVIGVSKWDTPWDIWARHKGWIDPKPSDQRMRCGKKLQLPVAEMFSEDVGLPFEWWDKPYFHPARPYQRVSVDAFVPKILKPEAVLEVKTAALDQVREWDRVEPGELGNDDGIPEYYYAQIQYQLSAYDLPLAYCVVLIAGNDLRFYKIPADLEVQEFLLERAEEFWRKFILGGEEPPITYSDAARAYIKRKFPRERQPLREASADEIGLLEEYGAVRAQLQPLEEQKDDLEIKLKQAVGDAEGVKWPGGKFTYKKSADRSKTSWRELAEKQLEGYAEDERKLMIAEFTHPEPGTRRIHFRDYVREAA